MKLNVFKGFMEKFAFKLFGMFAILIFIVCACFTMFSIYHEGKSSKDSLVAKGDLFASILCSNSRIGVFSENQELLRESVEGVLLQAEVLEVSVFNLEGKLLIKQVKPRVDIHREGTEPDVGRENGLLERIKESRVPFHVKRKNWLEFWVPVLSGSRYPSEESLYFKDDHLQSPDRVIGFVRITVGRRMLDEELNDLLFKSILMGITFLVIGCGLAYLMANGITNPLKKLTERVKALGTGEAYERVSVDTKDEIGRLAEAFNDMSESLRRREAEKQRIEEQLRHGQKMEAVGTLAGGIAHDFNNILAIILGYSELALEQAPEGSRLYADLQEVLKASHRGKDLVKQILTFSRRTDQERRPLEMNIIVKEALKMLRASLPTTIEIRQNIKEESAPVLSDPAQIDQVLMNLCTNAAYAMRDKGGVLEVSLAVVDMDSEAAARYADMAPGRYQRLTVSDTGCGMDRAFIERIFDPFFSTKGPGEGTGMGLATMHGIVKNHGGAIGVQSEPQKGTTFEVFFPTVEREVTEEGERFAPPRGHERILFVDDEVALAFMGQQMLGTLGYQVTARMSSVEALETFRARPYNFELVITDQTMPNLTGVDLAREIMHIRPDIPIILCTGFSEVMSEEKARGMGIQAFLMKPLTRNQIAETVRRVLDQV